MAPKSPPPLPPLDTKLRDWLNSPEQRELRQRVRKLGLKVDLKPPKSKHKPSGNKPALTAEQIERGKETYRGMLDKDPTWAKNKTASSLRLIELLGFNVGWLTVKRWIVDRS